MSNHAMALRKLGWDSVWISRVDSDLAISSLSDHASLELTPLDKHQRLMITLVVWPDPSTIYVELHGEDGSHVSLVTLKQLLLVAEAMFAEGFAEKDGDHDGH